MVALGLARPRNAREEQQDDASAKVVDGEGREVALDAALPDGGEADEAHVHDVFAGPVHGQGVEGCDKSNECVDLDGDRVGVCQQDPGAPARA
jgi:hypothetical protein